MCTLKTKQPIKVHKGDVVRVLPVGSIRPIGSYHIVVNAVEKRIVYTHIIHDGRTDQESCEYCFRKSGLAKIPVICVKCSSRVFTNICDGRLPANVSEDYDKWKLMYDKFHELSGNCVLKFINVQKKESIYVQAQTCIKTIKTENLQGSQWQEKMQLKVPQVTLVGVTRLD